jgi:hypothetical protein
MTIVDLFVRIATLIDGIAVGSDIQIQFRVGSPPALCPAAATFVAPLAGRLLSV